MLSAATGAVKELLLFFSQPLCFFAFLPRSGAVDVVELRCALQRECARGAAIQRFIE